MSKIFLKRGDIYNQTEDNFSISSRLDKGIFQIKQDQQTGVLFLERIANEFHFGFKLYGVDETLVKHVIDTYEKQPIKKNIGVLLNGAKGTGKTVTAKIMANKLGLPVIICDKSLLEFALVNITGLLYFSFSLFISAMYSFTLLPIS